MRLGSPEGVARYEICDKFLEFEGDEKMEEPHLSTWLQVLKIQRLNDRAVKRRAPCVALETV